MDIVERLRGYNPPDRTINEQRQMAIDIQEAADEIERLREALKKAIRFSRYVLQESSFQGCELDGGYAQDVAESIGLIVPHIATEENRDLWEQYEGCEMGCTFFEFVDWMREDSTALKETE